MKDLPTNGDLRLLSPDEVWDQIDPLAPDLDIEPNVAGLGTLPYARLLGPGFERLCYELLVAEGHSPIFFGRSGQPDYGVDIIVENKNIHALYQCKNLSAPPTWTEVQRAVVKFERDWLIEAGLPTPDSFVYCCPHPLDDIKFDKQWIEFSDTFKLRTGIRNISFWDKHALDTRLRRLPDIVAGLFSDSYAWLFCNCDDWIDDPWFRVCWKKSRLRSIQRFLDRHREKKIYVSEREDERFRELISESSAIVIRGVPGSGKTLTSLELACGLREPLRRIYYATFKDFPTDPQRLWQSVRRRGSMPSLFLLDDCHLNLEQAGLLIEHLRPELQDVSGRIKLILLMRDLPGSTALEELNDTPDWLANMEQDEFVINMETDLARTSEVAIHLRPDLIGISEKRLNNLYASSGGDLLLLDEILHDVQAPGDLDSIDLSHLYKTLRREYFGPNRMLLTLRRLACLAQFDLTPATSFFERDWEPREKELVASLVTELFAPPRYQFLHPSLAELVFRALLDLEMEAGFDEEAVIEQTKSELVAYLRYLATPNRNRAGHNSSFIPIMSQLLQVRLKLVEPAANTRIKVRILSEEFIIDEIREHLSDCSFLFLHICLMNLASSSNNYIERYVDLIERRFNMLLDHAGEDPVGIATIGTGFRTLGRYAPSRLEAIETAFGAEKFLNLIVANGTIFELFRILQFVSPKFREKILGQLSETKVAKLVDKTITSRRSIGTLDLTMREFGNSDQNLLRLLEDSIGPRRFLDLIVANGTIFELFRILERATPTFRKELLGQLDETIAATLVNKTIASGRSIATLNWAMRELGSADQVLLGQLEHSIGARHFMNLIVANGTIYELFRTLEFATPTFREELLGQLEEIKTTILVNKTTISGRSIATLGFAMRELSTANQVLLGQLEHAIGARRFTNLIIANGTIIDLFSIMKNATPFFREELLSQLDETKAATLVDKTIAASRSIESIHYALWKFRQSPKQLKLIEKLLGINNWWRLFIAIGSLNGLIQITRALTEDFRKTLVESSTELSVFDWQKIIGHSLLNNVCSFVNDEYSSYPATSQAAFEKALNETIATLVSRASWNELNSSRIPADSHMTEILQTALRPIIAKLKVDNLLGLNFREAVNGLAFAWRERSDLRPSLAEHLWEILPPMADWPEKKGGIASLRLVLLLARSELIADQDANRLIDEITCFLTPSVCMEMNTLPLFLLLWNLSALHYERAGAEPHSFEGALTEGTFQTLVDVLRQRVALKGPNKEKLAWLALGGLIKFLSPHEASEIKTVLSPLVCITQHLKPEALKQTFVPALFSLKGLELLCSTNSVFTPPVCATLLAKSDEYEDIGPAIDLLRQELAPLAYEEK